MTNLNQSWYNSAEEGNPSRVNSGMSEYIQQVVYYTVWETGLGHQSKVQNVRKDGQYLGSL